MMWDMLFGRSIDNHWNHQRTLTTSLICISIYYLGYFLFEVFTIELVQLSYILIGNVALVVMAALLYKTSIRQLNSQWIVLFAIASFFVGSLAWFTDYLYVLLGIETIISYEFIYIFAQSAYVGANVFICWFVWHAIFFQYRNLNMMQLLNDSVIILICLAGILWRFLLADWTMGVLAQESYIMDMHLFINIVIAVGSVLLLQIQFRERAEWSVKLWNIVGTFGIVWFMYMNYIEYKQFSLGMLMSDVSLGIGWQFAWILILISVYKQGENGSLSIEPQLLRSTWNKQIQNMYYLHVLGIVTVLVIGVRFDTVVFMSMLLGTHYILTKYIFTLTEKMELLKKYEIINADLERQVSDRTRDLRVKNTQLEQMAKYDVLTSLPNSRYLEMHCNQLIASQMPFTFAYLDLDRFKAVNDLYGHDIGDELLKAVANRVRDAIPKTAFFARQGGDEFIIICHENPNMESEIQALLDYVSKRFELSKHEIQTSFSIGVAKYPQHATTYHDIAKCADIALYQAKAVGKNRFTIYEASENRQLILEHDLKSVEFSEQFELYYQPQFDIQMNCLSGCEALIRWHHPVYGLLNPLEFIGLVEEIGEMNRLGKWIVEEAFSQLRNWQTQPEFVMAINLSVKQLIEPDFVQKVKNLLEKHQLSARQIEFELVESLRIEKSVEILHILNELNDLGIKLAVDDFGTGYSSLSYLKQFPIKKLKIARELVAEMKHGNVDQKIIQGIIDLSRSLELTVIAEGVETLEQCELLRKMDCEQVQGYYYSRPIPANDFSAQYLN